MTPERYRQVGSIYHAALELDRNARAAWPAEACAGDDALRQEVELLLASNEGAGDFWLPVLIECHYLSGTDRARLLPLEVPRSLPVL